MESFALHKNSGLLISDEQAGVMTNLQECVLAPALNSAIIEPYNAVASAVNALVKPVSGGRDLISRQQEIKTANPEFLSTAWLMQGTAAGLGILVPYCLAGRIAGGALRSGGQAFNIRGTSARLLQSEAGAQIIGAAVYDGIRETRPGETHVGNALGGAAAFGIFQAGHAVSKERPLIGKVAIRAVVGSFGALTQQSISGLYSNHELPDAESLGKAALSGMVMNMVLPETQRALSAAVDQSRMRLGLGVPQDRFINRSDGLKASMKQSPTVVALVNELPWVRIQSSAKQNSFDAGRQIVYLSERNGGIEKLGRELSRIRQISSEQTQEALNDANSLRKQGRIDDSWNAYRNLRLNQESQAQFIENSIAKELGRANHLMSAEQYAQEIAAWPSGGGLSHERRWRSEFVEFHRSEGQRGPGAKTSATGEYIPASAEPVVPQTRAAKIAEDVVRTLQEADELAVLAGGPVRDEIMGRQPKDFDIATSANPFKVERLFAEKGIKVLSVGKQFGTIKLIIDGEQIEVTTLRTDGNYTDGRRPDKVEYSNSLREDAARRDLTMNAMYKDPLTNNYYDLFGGRADIGAKKIRALGDPRQRFAEDNLRMMRVPRFAARYGFDVDADTLAAIQKNSVNLSRVSAERIREELRGVLASPKPSIGLDIMMNSGLMKQVIPEMLPLDGPRGKQDPVWHPEGNAWTHTRLVVDQLAANGNGRNFPLMMGGLLHDIAKPATMVEKPGGRISNPKHDIVGAEMAKVIAGRLKMSKNETSLIEKLVAQHMTMHAVREMRPGRLAELLKKPEANDLIELQNADANGKGVPDAMEGSHRQWLKTKLEELKKAEDPNKRLDARPIVDGHMINDLGFPKTAIRSEIIKAASHAQHEGAFSTESEARNWVLKNYAKHLKASTHMPEVTRVSFGHAESGEQNLSQNELKQSSNMGLRQSEGHSNANQEMTGLGNVLEGWHVPRTYLRLMEPGEHLEFDSYDSYRFSNKGYAAVLLDLYRLPGRQTILRYPDSFADYRRLRLNEIATLIREVPDPGLIKNVTVSDFPHLDDEWLSHQMGVPGVRIRGETDGKGNITLFRPAKIEAVRRTIWHEFFHTLKFELAEESKAFDKVNSESPVQLITDSQHFIDSRDEAWARLGEALFADHSPGALITAHVNPKTAKILSGGLRKIMDRPGVSTESKEYPLKVADYIDKEVKIKN